jgi:flavin reductase (DIM6/NTAB) family NADH-FMN oxidoreductase RutF
MDGRELRNALGRFPTGVAVVAARTSEGFLTGLTINSVTPVALAPARLLWSLGARSKNRPVFEAAAHFTVNVLAEGQISVAKQMSAPVADRFAGIAWSAAPHSGLPLIDGCIAAFECRRTSVTEIGDHVVFIGDILAFEERAGAPLLYDSGRYSRLQREMA